MLETIHRQASTTVYQYNFIFRNKGTPDLADGPQGAIPWLKPLTQQKKSSVLKNKAGYGRFTS